MIEQSIQEGIRHVLGESGLEMLLSLRPLSHLSTDPAGFHEFLKGIFMHDGATIIETEIASRLLEKVGNGRGMEGRSFLSWLGATFSRAKSSGGVSAREKDALGQLNPLSELLISTGSVVGIPYNHDRILIGKIWTGKNNEDRPPLLQRSDPRLLEGIHQRGHRSSPARSAREP